MNRRRYVKGVLEYGMALAIAVLTYLFFTLNENIDTSNFVIPLIPKFNDNFVALDAIPQTVEVTVKGNPSSLNKIAEKNMTAVADFSDVTTSGGVQVPVVLQRSGSFAQIHNVEVLVYPREIKTQLDRKIFKDLQVRLALVNSLPRGYTFEHSQILPRTVRVFGPSSVLQDIDVISTSNIDLSNVTENISMKIALQSPNALIESTEITNVKVSITVRQSIVVRVFNNVVPSIRNLSPDLVINGQVIRTIVTVQGSLLSLDGYSPQAFIDCYQYKSAGVYEVEIQMVAKKGVDVVSLEPNAVFIELRGLEQPVPQLDPRKQPRSNGVVPRN